VRPRFRYRYKKPRWIILFTLLDAIGEMVRRILAMGFSFWRRLPPPDPKNLLVLRLDHVGDVLLCTPALDALRARFPAARITVAVGPWSRQVVEGHPAVDAVVDCRVPWFDRSPAKPSMLSCLIQQGRSLRAMSFDMALDLRGDFRNILLLAVAGIPYRVGYADTGGGFLLNLPVWRRRFVHEVHRNLDLVARLGADHSSPKPRIMVTHCDREAVATLLMRAGVDPCETLVGIHPGAGAPSRTWSPRRFAAVAQALTSEMNVKIVLTGSEAEKSIVENIALNVNPHPVKFVGILTLKQLAALLERYKVLITGNTGPMHLAAAVGTPVVAVFSSSNTLEEWRPFGADHIVIQKEVPCAGCELEVCPKPIRCVELISPEEVILAAKRILQGERVGG